MQVLHHCDNRACVKTAPDEQYPEGHLFLGTHADNMADMVSKRRVKPNPSRTYRQHPLSADERLAIGLACATMAVSAVSRRFGVTLQTVRRCRNRAREVMS
jgi:hypothetical protein